MTGPAPDEEVWVAVERRGIPMHNPRGGTSRWTACNRDTFLRGVWMLARVATDEFGARPCPRCWPPPTDGGDA